MADPQVIRPAVAPWAPRARPSALTVEESARRLGHLRWVEGRLFEVLGGWVSSTPEVDVKLRLATSSRQHGWHTELWADRLPELAHLSAEQVTVPAGPEVGRALDLVAGASTTLERLVGVYRVVVPRLLAALAAQDAVASTVADATALRVLRLVVDDLTDDWRFGEAAIESLLRTEDDVARAADHQRAVESLLVAGGGICGPGTLGSPGSTAPVDISP